MNGFKRDKDWSGRRVGMRYYVFFPGGFRVTRSTGRGLMKLLRGRGQECEVWKGELWRTKDRDLIKNASDYIYTPALGLRRLPI